SLISSLFPYTTLFRSDAYRFGKDLGYLDVSFEKFLEEARAGDVNDDSRKSRGKLGYYIIKAAEEKNLGFSVDWKWEAVDIVGFRSEEHTSELQSRENL